MNTSERSEDLRQTDHAEEHRRNSSSDTVQKQRSSSEQTPPRGPVGPFISDEGAFETFVDGSGI
jgi:hypothetical protein